MVKTNKRKQQRKSKLLPVFDTGNKFVTTNFVAFFLPAEEFSSTIIASKKIGNAVKRNRSKRRLREVIRLHIEPNVTPIQLIFLSRNSTADSDYPLLMKDCQNLIKKINHTVPSQNIAPAQEQ